MDNEAGDFLHNITYCLKQLPPFKGTTRKEKARILGVDKTSIGRWLKGSTPRDDHVTTLADLVGCSSKADLYLPKRDFLQLTQNLKGTIAYHDIRPVVQFASIAKHEHLWDECVYRLQGTYFLYTRVLTNEQLVARSLLRIYEKTERGITFDIHNVDNRTTPRRVYKYGGLLFPVFDSVFFYAEESSFDEPLVMITTYSQVKSPENLIGYMLAVGVDPKTQARTPRGSKLVCSFVNVRPLELSQVIEQLGVIQTKAVDKSITDLLFAIP